jgi:glutathione S-transferase
VPVLLQNEITVWDTLAIAEYLHEHYPHAKIWPKNAKLRALARSYSAEMHSGFASLRSQCSMDLSLKIQIKHLTHSTIADITRILEMWKAALKKSKGPYLFGDFCAADAFFAPVVCRFISYGIDISDPAVLQYMDNVINHHGVAYWIAESKKEKVARARF